MLLHKKINFDGTDQIISFYNDLIGEDISKSKFGMYGAPIDKEIFQKTHPEFISSLEKYDLKIKEVFLMSMVPGAKVAPHIEWTKEAGGRMFSFNIPIRGTKGTRTYWMNNTKITNYQLTPYGSEIPFCGKSFGEVIDEIEFLEPTLIRVDVPHGIDNPNPTNRIAISIRFMEEPLILWDENEPKMAEMANHRIGARIKLNMDATKDDPIYVL